MQSQSSLHEPSQDLWIRLDRFLTLGSDDGTYAVQRPVAEPAPAAIECLRADGARTVEAILKFARSGSVIRLDPALYALALASSPKYADAPTNAAALDALPALARTGDQLLRFVEFAKQVRGWGRGLRAAIASWYTVRPLGELERLIVKYPSGHGWTHADLIRLSHPETSSASRNALFEWLVDGDGGKLADRGLWLADAVERLKTLTDEEEAARIVRDFRLGRVSIPERLLESAAVWEALVEGMDYAQLLGCLPDVVQRAGGRASSDVDGGRIDKSMRCAARSPKRPGQDPAHRDKEPNARPSTDFDGIAARIANPQRIGRSGVQPIQILIARARCGAGVEPLASALDLAYQLAFRNVMTTAKRLWVVIDAVAQSAVCGGTPELKAAKAAEALAAVLAASHVETIQHGGWPDAVGNALSRGADVDGFVVLTGGTAPTEPSELARYREQTGIATKLVIVSLCGHPDAAPGPVDELRLNIQGFDETVPAAIEIFLRD